MEHIELYDDYMEVDDYIAEDGYLYCGKCNTRKARLVGLGNNYFVLPFNCKCKQEESDKQAEEDAKRDHIQRIRELRSLGFPDAEMSNWTFEKDDLSNPSLSRAAKKYVDNFEVIRQREPRGLVLYGSVGTGKTFIAACIANALIDKGHPCLVTNFPRIVNKLTSLKDDKQEYLDSLNEFDLLVIDDLESERNTEYMGELVMNVIDSRCRAKKPLIVTTNLTAEEMKKPQEMRRQRIYSRIWEMCYPIEVKGGDRRRAILNDNYSRMKDMLEL